MSKATPKEWVDDLLEVGVSAWIPPVRRYDESRVTGVLERGPGAEGFDWFEEWRALHRHHQRETDVLFAVIREMARRLGASPDPSNEPSRASDRSDR